MAAVSARDVILTFRAQNYLSSAIRRVSRDVSGLSRGQTLSRQQSAASLASQRLRYSLRIAEADRLSVTSGVRRMAVDRARVNLTNREENHLQRIRRNGEAIARNTEDQLASETKMEQLLRAQKTGRPVGRGLRQMNQQQIARAIEAETIAQDRLLNARIRLERETELLNARTEQQSALVQQLAAREIALTEREAQLTAAIHTRNDALQASIREEQRLAYMESRILPVQMWQDRARAVEHFGRVLQMVGLVGTVALGAAAHSAATLQTQAVLAATQARPPGAGVGSTIAIGRNVQKQVIDLMRQFPASAAEQYKGFYEIFSGTNVQNVGQAAEMLKTFNQMAVAGGTSLETMVQAGITLHNVFPNEFKNATDAANTFFAAVRYGRVTADQLASALPYLVPIAKDVGLNFKNAAGDIAFFTRQTGGRLTRQDAQGIARLYQLLGRQDVSTGLAKRGIDVFRNGNMRPVVDILDDVRKRLHLTNQETLNFFKTMSASGSGKQGTQGTIQALRIFSLGVHSGNAYRDVIKKVATDQDEMVKSFQAMSQQPGVRWGVFINQLKALAYVVGLQVIPVFIQLSRPVLAITRWFMRLSPHTQRLISLFLVIGSVGGLVVGTLVSIGAALVVLVTQITMWRRMRMAETFIEAGVAAERSGGQLALFGSEAGFISGRMALGLGIPAVIFLLFKFHKQVGEVVDKLGGLENVIKALSIAMAAFTAVRVITAMGLLGTAAAGAATEVGILDAALLGLGSPAVLAALAAAAAALLILKGARDNLNDVPQTPTSPSRRVYQDKNGNYHILHRTANRGSRGTTITPVTPEQAQAAGAIVPKAIASNPRLSYDRAAIVRAERIANQAAERAKARTRAQNRLDKEMGVTSNLTQAQVIQQYIDRVTKARRLTLAHPNSIAAAKAYEIAVANLNKRFKDQPALLAAINDVLQNYDSNLKSATGSTKTLGVTQQDVLSKLQSMYQDFQTQEQNVMGNLFNGPFMNNPLMQNRLQWGHRTTGMDLSRDLRSQLTQFRNFHGLLNSLQRRGAPNALIDQLRQMGPDAIKQIRALGQLSKPELQRYFGMFREEQKLVQQQSMKDLNRQLKIYRSHGRNIALAIVAGLRDENVTLTKALTNMVRKMFPGLPVGSTGAGGKPGHRATTPTQKVAVKVDVNHKTDDREGKPPLTKKAAERHKIVAERGKYAGPIVGGPR